jgi:hypothetical protein
MSDGAATETGKTNSAAAQYVAFPAEHLAAVRDIGNIKKYLTAGFGESRGGVHARG